MIKKTEFDGALSHALQARALPSPSALFAAKLQARCALETKTAAHLPYLPQGLTPVYAAAGSLVTGLLIGVMLFTTLNPPVAAPITNADNSADILYHYVYKSAV